MARDELEERRKARERAKQEALWEAAKRGNAKAKKAVLIKGGKK